MDPELQAQDPASNGGDNAAAAAANAAGQANSADNGAPAPGQQGSPVSAADLHQQQQAANGGNPPANPAADGTPAAQGGPAAAAGTPPAQQQWDSARAYAQSLGFAGAQQFQDDQQFVQALLGAAQQREQYQQQLQFLAQQNAALLRQAQAPAQPAAPPPAPEDPLKKLWNPPEYNPAWEGLVGRDEQGNYQLKPGAPPDLLPKYLAYHQYRREFADKLTSDPMAVLNPLVETKAAQIAEKALSERMRAYEDKAYTDNFISQNSAWLHQRDAQGNLVTNPATGRPFLTPEGQTFQQHVLFAERTLGITDLRHQEQYARSMLQRDLAMLQWQRAQQAAQGQAGKDQVVQQGNRVPAGTQPNRSGSLWQPGNPNPQPAQNPGLSLRESLAQAFSAGGFTLDGQV